MRDYVLRGDAAPTTPPPPPDDEALAPWRAIVRSAYAAHVAPLRAACTDAMDAPTCLESMQKAAAGGAHPWWIATMLRDALNWKQGFIRGTWHAHVPRINPCFQF